jgi:nitroalkane oxidase
MSIEFTLTDAQRQLQRDCRQFSATHLAKVRDLVHALPTPEERFLATRPVYEELVRAGFLKRLIPAPFGGTGSGMVDMAIAAEEFYAADVNVSLTMFGNLLGLMPVFVAGTDEQKARYVSPFLECRGAPLAALANSEPGGSANFAAPAPHGTRTQARLEGGSWVIDGEKQWVSSATGWDGKGADFVFVVCRTPAGQGAPAGLSIIAVPRGTPGVEPVRFLDTLGHRAHLLPVFRLNGVRVPRENLVGPLGGAQAVVAESFSGTAAIVGAMSVGVMRAAFDFALRFCRSDARGGPHPIIDYPTVGYALADAKGAIEACRWLALRASAAMDAQEPCALELNLHAKVYCSETAVRVITDLMRVVGIDSYDHRLPLAGLLQDALVLPLFDGGNNGVRRRQLHAILKAEGYDPHGSIGGA